jgi:hypothetical protein
MLVKGRIWLIRVERGRVAASGVEEKEEREVSCNMAYGRFVCLWRWGDDV